MNQKDEKVYVVEWKSDFTGYTGRGTTRFTLAECQKICRESDKKYIGLRHYPVLAVR